MGKMGRNPFRNRKKYNQPGSADDDGRHPNVKDSMQTEHSVAETKFIKSSLFSGVSIDTSKITQKLVFAESEDRLTKRPRLWEPYKQSKEARRQQKKANFVQLVKAQQKEREEEKKTSRRKQTVIVGDMKPILDTLPALKSVKSGNEQPQKAQTSSKTCKTFKQRQKELMSDMEIFRKVLEHPSFAMDPTGTMLEHLQNKFCPST